jgi:hypothetical protein
VSRLRATAARTGEAGLAWTRPSTLRHWESPKATPPRLLSLYLYPYPSLYPYPYPSLYPYPYPSLYPSVAWRWIELAVGVGVGVGVEREQKVEVEVEVEVGLRG